MDLAPPTLGPTDERGRPSGQFSPCHSHRSHCLVEGKRRRKCGSIRNDRHWTNGTQTTCSNGTPCWLSRARRQRRSRSVCVCRVEFLFRRQRRRRPRRSHLDSIRFQSVLYCTVTVRERRWLHPVRFPVVPYRLLTLQYTIYLATNKLTLYVCTYVVSYHCL